MVLDEPRNGDKVFDINGITYLVEKDFFDRVKPLTVDYNDAPNGAQFSISSVAYRFSLRVFL
jgi:Fe-S cluster assembly iron-binding protein IscA